MNWDYFPSDPQYDYNFEEDRDNIEPGYEVYCDACEHFIAEIYGDEDYLICYECGNTVYLNWNF